MQTPYINQIVNEILTDISKREKDSTAPAVTSSVPNFEDAFGELIQEDDQTSKDVMRRIWKELQKAHGTRRVK